jgi:hypothetical protein
MSVKKEIKMRFYIFRFLGDSLACFIGFCGQEFHKKKNVIIWWPGAKDGKLGT